MSNILVIAADNTCARIFRASSSTGPLEEITVLCHPENRLNSKDMTSDKQGYSFSSHGYGRRAMSDEGDRKKQEVNRFVNEINEYLNTLEKNNDFNRLIVIAAPKLMGILKKQLSDNVQKHITYELNKNIAKLTAVEIRKFLPKYLVNPNL